MTMENQEIVPYPGDILHIVFDRSRYQQEHGRRLAAGTSILKREPDADTVRGLSTNPRVMHHLFVPPDVTHGHGANYTGRCAPLGATSRGVQSQ